VFFEKTVQVDITTAEFAQRLARSHSKEQAKFFDEFASALQQACGNEYHVNKQLAFIAKSLTSKAFMMLRLLKG